MFELVSPTEVTAELFELLPLERINPRDLLKHIPADEQKEVFT